MNPLYRLGLATATHPWRTISTWLVVLVAVGAAAASWGGSTQEGVEALRAHLPEAGGAVAQVVVHTGDARALEHATPVAAPRMSAADEERAMIQGVAMRQQHRP